MDKADEVLALIQNVVLNVMELRGALETHDYVKEMQCINALIRDMQTMLAIVRGRAEAHGLTFVDQPVEVQEDAQGESESDAPKRKSFPV